MDKCQCGEVAIGSINGRRYCGKTECINYAMGAAFFPIKQALTNTEEGKE